MKEYTDQDYKRVAKFVGWDYYALRQNALDSRPKGSDPDNAIRKFHARLLTRLLSPEGRCAIEDKFRETEWDGLDYLHDKDGDRIGVELYYSGSSFRRDGSLIGWGKTIAEAWLSAAMNASKEVGK
jgi:hypothetical protein